MSQLTPAEIQAAVESALAEDYRGSDLTGAAVLDPGQECRAQVIARDKGVVCGIGLAEEVFRQLPGSVRVVAELQDGASLEPGSVVLRLSGAAAAILAGERTALNFLQHLSGIASLTARYVELARPFGVVILDTRKTVPGLRRLEKYATRTGGARNHRMGLFDAILIKDNHVELAGGLAAAVSRATRRHPAREVEVEVRSQAELEVALELQVGRVLLDNFTPSEVSLAIARVGGRAEVEVSGGVDLENVAAYAAARPDYISVGRLTHSASALDLALKVVA
ncbi:MAG TPA: carboxylating nicotinate-nucleotide diphosphorylase [Candidatus Dormibacteraeota bacterium]|nr:carboxylating nicotinate-nucleotide diphosphorylase [Candidatus Dormibacteraeota bacterium]